MIKNFEELQIEVCSDTDYPIDKAIYKVTDCGAWIAIKENGVVIGSIVEDAEYGTDEFEFTYPFEIKDFWTALDEIEVQAEEIWLEHNDDYYGDFEIADNMLDTFAEYIAN